MLVTELYNGQGLGNQLFCYVTTRVIAAKQGYDFGVMSPEKFKGHDFLDLDFGKSVIGGSGPEGGPPRSLPKGVKYYYNERKISHPKDRADLRTYDPDLMSVPDGTKIDGVMQDEQYIVDYRNQIRQWLTVKEAYDCQDFASEDICVINFRGGEYVNFPDLFLTQKYWDDAVDHMLQQNKDLHFVVITDDVKAARKFFPNFEVYHFNIGKDYAIIKNAHYLILSNSSFAWFPAWLSTNLKYCIAPKYWARHNAGDGLWSCSSNLTSGWMYLDKDGELFDYKTCKKELAQTIKENPQIFEQKKLTNSFLVISHYYNDLSWVTRYTDNYLIYDQSDEPIYAPGIDPKKVVKALHRGHNIRDYCTYIIDHYDSLPDRVLFCAGNVIPRHVSREYFDRIVNNDYFTPIEDYTKHAVMWPNTFFSGDGGFCERNTSWYLNLANNFHPTKYFHSYDDFLRFCFVDPVIPRYVRFAPGANYIVPKENIRKLPKVFYENLRIFVSHTDKAIPGESHLIERAFYTLWNANFAINENMLRPLPENFKARPRVPLTRSEKFVRRVEHEMIRWTKFGQKVTRFMQRLR